MHRRTVLTLCGAGIASLAGCSSGREDGGATDETRPTSTATTATATPTETALTVEFDALQSALVELHTDYYELVAESDRQYLVLDVAVASGPPPSRSALAFRFDGDEHPPRTSDFPLARQDETGGDQYASENGSGRVVFELPATGDASDAALVWPGGEWRPDDRLRGKLATPSPPLTLVEWQGPETVPLGSTTTFEFAVRNEGDRTGWFVGGINARGWYPHRPIARLARRIPPGETAAWEVTGEAIELVNDSWTDRVGDGDADIQYELRWSGGDDGTAVRIVDA